MFLLHLYVFLCNSIFLVGVFKSSKEVFLFIQHQISLHSEQTKLFRNYLNYHAVRSNFQSTFTNILLLLAPVNLNTISHQKINIAHLSS